MIKQEWKEAIATWAASVPEVQKAYVVGSRAKGISSESSDLDVAIILRDDDKYGIWFFANDEWKSQLQSMLDIELHLLRGSIKLGNPTIAQAVREHGVLVFDRSENGSNN